jgi:hypothetical protein
MPVGILSTAQRERYGRYDGDPSADELARYFHLDDADHAAIGGKRGEHNRLGYAVQLTTVRFLGTFLEDLATVPAGVVQTLRRQLGINGPEQLIEYAQGEQRWAHAEQIRTDHGYRAFTDPTTGFALARWLYSQSGSRGFGRIEIDYDRVAKRDRACASAHRLAGVKRPKWRCRKFALLSWIGHFTLGLPCKPPRPP